MFKSCKQFTQIYPYFYSILLFILLKSIFHFTQFYIINTSICLTYTFDTQINNRHISSHHTKYFANDSRDNLSAKNSIPHLPTYTL